VRGPTDLSLANNPQLGAEGVNAICEFVALPNHLRHLNLQNTGAHIESTPRCPKSRRNGRSLLKRGVVLRWPPRELRLAADVFGALARGCLTDLAELNLADNKFSKKGGAAPLAFGQFFASAAALQRVDMSGTRIPPDLLETMLMSLAQNSTARKRALADRAPLRRSPRRWPRARPPGPVQAPATR